MIVSEALLSPFLSSSTVLVYLGRRPDIDLIIRDLNDAFRIALDLYNQFRTVSCSPLELSGRIRTATMTLSVILT